MKTIRLTQKEKTIKYIEQIKNIKNEIIKENIIKEGEIISDPSGEKLIDTRTIYGGGYHFVVENDFIFFLWNNGHDGDDWSLSNCGSSIAYKIPYNETMHKTLKEINEFYNKSPKTKQKLF